MSGVSSAVQRRDRAIHREKAVTPIIPAEFDAIFDTVVTPFTSPLTIDRISASPAPGTSQGSPMQFKRKDAIDSD